MTANHQTYKAHQPHYWYQLQEKLCDKSYFRALALQNGIQSTVNKTLEKKLLESVRDAVSTYFYIIACSFGSCLIVTPCDPRCVTGFWGCMLWMPTRKHHYTVLLVRVPAQLSRSRRICFPLRVEMDCNDVGVICARTADWTEVSKVFIELNHSPSCFLYFHIVVCWTSNSNLKRFPFRETRPVSTQSTQGLKVPGTNFWIQVSGETVNLKIPLKGGLGML